MTIDNFTDIAKNVANEYSPVQQIDWASSNGAMTIQNRKTATYQPSIFSDEFILKLADMGYDGVQIPMSLANSDLFEASWLAKWSGFVEVATAEKENFPDSFKPLLSLKSEKDLDQISALKKKYGNDLVVELQLNKTWSFASLLKALRHESKLFFFDCPVSLTNDTKNLQAMPPWETFAVVESLRDLGYQVQPRPDKPATNTTMPFGHHYENGYEILVQNPIKTRSVEFSLIIPVYNNRRFVVQVLRNLNLLIPSQVSFEVILCDDGSSDGLREEILQCQSEFHFPLTVLHIRRQQDRSMGDLQYRAGLARNIGVGFSRGEYLVFLDSDVLVPPSFLLTLAKEMELTDLVMCRRLHINSEESQRLPQYKDILPKHLMEVDLGYWIEFHKQGHHWNSLSEKWKYVCTHSLCVRRSLFKKVGGIPNNYNIYGYEDVNLGFMIAKAGGTFRLSENTVYHLSPKETRSEYAHEHKKKLKLLEKSASIFYSNTLDESVFKHCNALWQQPEPLLRVKRQLLKTQGSLQRFFLNLYSR